MRHVPRLVGVALIMVILGSTVAEAPPARSSASSAQGLEQILNLPIRKVRIATGLVGFFTSLNARNRVYRDARIVQRERNAYYDALIAKADALRSTDDSPVTDAATSTAANRAYDRLVERIEHQREIELQLAEDEKREARAEFHRKFQANVRSLLLSSSGGRALLGKIGERLTGITERIEDVRAALEQGSPDAALDRLVAGITDIPEIRQQLKILGGRLAASLDRQLGGLLSTADKIREGGVASADDALATLDSLSETLELQVDTARRLQSSSDEGVATAPVTVATGDGVRAANDAIAAALTAMVLDGNPAFDPERRPQMRQRVRDLMEKNTLDHNREIRAALGHAVVECRAVSESVFLATAAMLGRDTAIPEGDVQFFVFYLQPEDRPIDAVTFVVESEGQDEEGTQSDDESTTTTVRSGTGFGGVIPSGTYTGSFDESALQEAWLYDYPGTVGENTLTITVDPQGRMSGGGAMRSTGQFLGCNAYSNWTMTIAAGQIVSPELPMTLSVSLKIDDMSVDACKGCTCADMVYDRETMPAQHLQILSYRDGIVSGRWIDIEEVWQGPPTTFELTAVDSG